MQIGETQCKMVKHGATQLQNGETQLQNGETQCNTRQYGATQNWIKVQSDRTALLHCCTWVSLQVSGSKRLHHFETQD